MFRQLIAFLVVLSMIYPPAIRADCEDDDPTCADTFQVPVALGDLLYYESFDQDPDWEPAAGASVPGRIDHGGYHVTAYHPMADTWVLAPESYRDVVIEVTVESLIGRKDEIASRDRLSKPLGVGITINQPGTTSGYGLACRASTAPNQGSGYFFVINDAGQFSIRGSQWPESAPIVDWTYSEAIHTDGANTLRAACLENYLAFWVNDVFVTALLGPDDTTGQVGLVIVASLWGQPVEVIFDDFRVWQATLSEADHPLASILATVNGDAISAGEFRQRVRLERLVAIETINGWVNDLMEQGFDGDSDDALNQLYQFDPDFQAMWSELAVPDQMGLRVLNAIIDERLLVAEAARLGITVDQEDIDRQVEALLLPDTDDLPTQIPEERVASREALLADFYDWAVEIAGITREDIDAYFALQALRDVMSYSVVEPATTTIWVNSRHILTETEADALAIIDALNNGESFEDLARERSTDVGSGERGGELGWQDSTLYVSAFAAAVRAAPLGEIAGPVETDYGFHVIQVQDREERDLSEAQIQVSRQEAFEDWVAALRDDHADRITISETWLDFPPEDPPFTLRER